MQQLGELLGVGLEVFLGGRRLTLLPLRVKDWLEAANHLNQRRTPCTQTLRQMLPDMTEPQQRMLLETAYRDARRGDLLSLWEIEEWFSTPEGRVYQRWLMLRQRQPELTLEQVEQLLRAAELVELKRLELAAEEQSRLPSVGPTTDPGRNENLSPGECGSAD